MPEQNEFVIQTNSLAKNFAGVHAVKGIDLKVPKNSIFGFLGPNGAGKTTVMKMLLGLIRPSGGKGYIFGQDITRDSVQIRERIGYLPQQPRFIDHMTARELMDFTLRFYFKGPANKMNERINDMLELVGLEQKMDRPIKGFSGGEKQRLGIALAQVNYPDLLILDEPAAALDPIGRMQVLQVMERLRKHTTIFYSTHILDDVQRVSDFVAILNQGQLLVQGPIDEILAAQNEIMFSSTVKSDHYNQLVQRIQDLPWVSRVALHPGKDCAQFNVVVSDENAGETRLLREILCDDTVTVLEFHRKRYELEEVFMDMVKEVDHAK